MSTLVGLAWLVGEMMLSSLTITLSWNWQETLRELGKTDLQVCAIILSVIMMVVLEIIGVIASIAIIVATVCLSIKVFRGNRDKKSVTSLTSDARTPSSCYARAVSGRWDEENQNLNPPLYPIGANRRLNSCSTITFRPEDPPTYVALAPMRHVHLRPLPGEVIQQDH